MRLDVGKLRAFLDKALSPDELDLVQKQLANSPEARATLVQLRQECEQTAEHLAVLTPPQAAYSAAPQALNRLRAHLTDQPIRYIDKKYVEITERIKMMLRYSFIKQYQSAFVILAVVGVIALLFSFAPVRAMAADFLTIFRVQQVKVIPVDVRHIEDLENNEELKGLLDQFDPEPEVVSGGGDPQQVDTLAEAATLVDFPVAEIGALPDDAGELNQILVHEATVYHLNLDKGLLESIFNAAGIEISLPDSLNEEPIVVNKSAAIYQQWGPAEAPTLDFMQLRSPVIDHPDDLDLNALGVAVLQFLGKSKEEAIALGNTIDWANTLLLPVPNDDDVTATEVSINGANGVVFTKAKSDESGAMWQRDGITYLLKGNYSVDQILAAAQSVN